MWVDVGEQGAFGHISTDEFDALPQSIREEFLDSIRIEEYRDDRIVFPINCETSERLYERIKRFQKNRARSELRKQNLMALSGGIYEKEDIENLFEIQEGRCYYTGAPLTRNPKNYAVDHIVPVTEGGSSWPGNLALASVEVNREKHNRSKRHIFATLEKRYGKGWRADQREFCKRVDARRRAVDKARKRCVEDHLNGLLESLEDSFPGIDLDYHLEDDVPVLLVDYTEVTFPAGFMRQKDLFGSLDYLAGVVKAVLAQPR